MKLLLKIFLLWIPVLAFSQKLPKVDALNRVILNHKDSIIYAHLLPAEDNDNVKVSDKYWYNWYAQHDIKETKGGFDGKLLHGEYTEYYDTKDLKRKGIVKKGLKKGKWKSWYKNGQISEITYYKNGLRHGKYVRYTSTGALATKGKYKKGILVVKKIRKKETKDTLATEKKSEKKSKKNKPVKDKKVNKKKQKTAGEPALGEEGKEKDSLKKEKKKKEKTPQIRLRRSIKVVPQPGKST